MHERARPIVQCSKIYDDKTVSCSSRFELAGCVTLFSTAYTRGDERGGSSVCARNREISFSTLNASILQGWFFSRDRLVGYRNFSILQARSARNGTLFELFSVFFSEISIVFRAMIETVRKSRNVFKIVPDERINDTSLRTEHHTNFNSEISIELDDFRTRVTEFRRIGICQFSLLPLYKIRRTTAHLALGTDEF